MSMSVEEIVKRERSLNTHTNAGFSLEVQERGKFFADPYRDNKKF